MDISDSLISFILRNDDDTFHQLRCDLADLICVLPRNSCEELIQGDEEKTAKFNEIKKLEYVNPIEARRRYLRLMNESQRLRKMETDEQD